MKIGFIGVGHLATALLNGLLNAGMTTADSLILYDRVAACLVPWREKGVRCAENEAQVVAGSDVIFLVIRPGDFSAALSAVRDRTPVAGKLFVSTAAAVSTAFISEGLGGAKVVRTMPNTALSLGMSATALCAGAGVSQTELETVRRLFEACGKCVVLDESQMEKVIAVNGSSPAYVYYLAQAMTDWAVKQGFDAETAAFLTAQTFAGASEMMLRSEHTPEQLCNAVCTPGGTSIEAIRTMREAGLDRIVSDAMDACTRRAMELRR